MAGDPELDLQEAILRELRTIRQLLERKTSFRSLQARERALQAKALRDAGHTLQDIGEQLGVTGPAVHKMLRRLERELEAAQEARELEEQEAEDA